MSKLSHDLARRPGNGKGFEEGEVSAGLAFFANPLPMWIYDLESLRFLEVNQAAIAHYGYCREEFLAMRITDLRPPEEAERLRRFFESNQQELRRAGRWRHCRKDGGILDVEVTSQPVQYAERKARFVVVQDITERTRAEKDAQERTTYLNILIQSSPLGIVVMDPEHRVQLCNAAFEQLFQYKQVEILGALVDDLLAPGDLAEEARQLTRRASQGETVHLTTKRRRRDGSLVEVEVHGVPLLAGEEVRGAFAIYEDISARRRAEEGQRAAAERYRLLFEHNLAGVCRSTLDGRVLHCNESFARILGYDSPEEISSHRAVEFYFSAADREEHLRKLRAQGSLTNFELRLKRKDGSAVWVLENATVLEGGGGGPAVFEGTIIDISERRRAEEEQHAAETRYRTLVEQLPAITYIAMIGATGPWKYVSPQIQSLLGFSPEEWMADPSLWLRQIHPNDREQVLSLEARCQHAGDQFDAEYRVLVRDGRVAWFRDRGVVLETVPGQPLVMHGVMLDITDQKRAEEALRHTEQEYRSIVENAVEGIFQTTPDGGYISVNPALARMYGYKSPAELMGSVSDIGRQVYVDASRRSDFKRLMEENDVVERFEYQVFRRDGTKIWLSENARAVRDASGNVAFYEGTVEDVTERKRVETERQVMYEIIHGVNVTSNLDELLRLIHQSLKKVLYAENCFVALHDAPTGMFNFPFWVDQFDPAPPPQKLEKSCTAYVFRSGAPQLIPEDRFQELVKRGEAELVGTPSPTWLGVPLNTPTETIGVLAVQHYEDMRAYGERELQLLASVGSQIALAIDRKRSEDALREKEARLRLLIEQLPAVLWTTDCALKFTSSSGAGLANMGLKPNEVVGQSLFEYFKTQDPEFIAIAAHRRALEGEAVTFEVQWNGQLYESHVEPLRGAESRIVGTIGMALDTSERRQLEEQLRQSQKMEAVGRLAGGVAHDFNNLLMVIRGYSELLLDGAQPGDPVNRCGEQIQKAADRAASLTRQLLAFSRKQVLAPTVLDINAVVADMDRMLRRLIGEDIELATATHPDLGRVKADRGQIEQVILNLAVNGRDAMPHGGKLTLETGNAELDEEYSRSHVTVKPGRYVMLAVTDTGCGMDSETQAHIFEPFFTTKSKGTGLGLATVYGVVKQSGGYIWVYSEPGRGTTFKVYLPRVQSEVAAAATPSSKELLAGSETVLLVEDEEGVRALAREFLERSGYEVLVAQSGAEAIQIAGEHSGQIHVLMTDVVMPGMSGRELAEEMTRLRPEIRVLYMSGYTDDAIVHHGILDRGTVLLQKPFTRRSLSAKIREVLELKPAR